MSSALSFGRSPISCVAADDHPAVLKSVCAVLEEAGIEIRARARDGEEALAQIASHRPTVALLDLALPRLTGIDIARRAGRSAPETAVILYTGFGDVPQVNEALDVGVRGVILKGAPLTDLVRAIEVVTSGGAYIDPVLAADLTRVQRGNGDPQLTQREREVLRLLSEGHANDEIAARLFISPETVKSHIGKAKRKLGSTTRTEAVATALRRSLIS